MSSFLKNLHINLEARKHAGLGRSLLPIERHQGKHVLMNGRQYLSFASNDFLGLGTTRLHTLCANMQTGSGASRLVTGTTTSTLEAELSLARHFGYESCLIFGSGFLANLTLISTLFGNNDIILLDKRAHTSTVAGTLHSRAVFHTFKHNRLSHLEKLLQRQPAQAVLTESLFSMDGDSPDFTELAALKERFDFTCIVDEAHAFGVLGHKGRGLAHEVADIAVGTFGKAFGLFGAFILMPEIVREYLIHFGQGFIYTTALPPWHGEAVQYMLEKVIAADKSRDQLRMLGDEARTMLREAGYKVHGSAHILGIEIGDETFCQHLTNELLHEGILLFAARFPTVPLGQAMLRVCLTSLHTSQDITTLCEALDNAKKNIS